MKPDEVLNACIDMMREHIGRGQTLDLYLAVVPPPLDDFATIVSCIQQADDHTRAALLKKIDKTLMDSETHRETVGEALMFRLRLENAIRMLTVLSKAKVPCEVSTTIPEEAVIWALTTLWSGSGVQWVCRTAQAFLEGRPSALPWPIPN